MHASERSAQLGELDSTQFCINPLCLGLTRSQTTPSFSLKGWEWPWLQQGCRMFFPWPSIKGIINLGSKIRSFTEAAGIIQAASTFQYV